MAVFKKLVTTFAATVMLGTVLAGCGDKDSASSSEGKGKGSDEQVTITYWDGAWNTNTAKIVEKFEEKYPNINIDVQQFPDNGMSDKYLLALKQGNGPDLVNMAVDWIHPFEATGGLLPLDDFIKEENVDLKDFYDGAITVATIEDKVYALPYRSETHGLIYNTELFSKEGIDSSKGPKDWTEVLEAAKKITKDDTFGMALPGTNLGNVTTQLFNMIQSNGGSVLNEDNTKSTLSQPEALEMAELYVDLYKKHKVVPNSMLQNDNVANRNLFANGKIGMYMSGIYDIEPIKQANANAKLGVAKIPANSDQKIILGGWAVGITKESENPEAAWKFLNFITQPDISAEYSVTFSSRKSAATNEKYQDPLSKAFLESLEYAEPLPQIPQWNQIKQIVFDQLQLALTDELSTEEAMKQASKSIDELLSN
jgi:multiple sugar transport system substrate-binding protein